MIARKQVLLNGHPAVKSNTVHPYDQVTVSLATALAPQPDLAVHIVHSDQDLIVLDKPAGLPSVALHHAETHTLANFLMAHFPDTATAGPRALETGLVHRLDTETSGLLLAARTPFAYAALRKQFHKRAVGKEYLAIVEGKLRKAGQSIVALTPTGPRGQRMRIVPSGQGQEAITCYAPVEQFSDHTLVRLSIITGVRHQIRAQLAALGHPILGDVLYGAATSESTRLCLHAETITFQHPTTDREMRLTAPSPVDFTLVLQRLRDAHGH